MSRKSTVVIFIFSSYIFSIAANVTRAAEARSVARVKAALCYLLYILTLLELLSTDAIPTTKAKVIERTNVNIIRTNVLSPVLHLLYLGAFHRVPKIMFLLLVSRKS
ncbi:hypothetical protein [Pontibacter rugosus]